MGALFLLLRAGAADSQQNPVTVLNHLGYLGHLLSTGNDHERLGGSMRP